MEEGPRRRRVDCGLAELGDPPGTCGGTGKSTLGTEIKKPFKEEKLRARDLRACRTLPRPGWRSQPVTGEIAIFTWRPQLRKLGEGPPGYDKPINPILSLPNLHASRDLGPIPLPNPGNRGSKTSVVEALANFAIM